MGKWLIRLLPQFERLVDDELPALGAHLHTQGVHPSMYCSHWFITVFAYTLPFEHLLRVWDIFLFEGLKVSVDTHYEAACSHAHPNADALRSSHVCKLHLKMTA